MSDSTRWTLLSWKLDASLRTWLMALSARLHINPSVLIRMFLVQLKEGEPATRSLLFTFLELGWRDPVMEPTMLRISVEKNLQEWVSDFVRGLQHPDFPKRRVWSHHLLTGYARYLQLHEKSCVRYGAIRLEGVQEV